jgi:xanthine dehydrogenase/oxidase
VAYKQAKRRDDDIAIVNAAFNVTVSEGRVAKLRMAFGGMAPVTKMGLLSARAVEGHAWERGLVEAACSHLAAEFQLPPDVPGAMARCLA